MPGHLNFYTHRDWANFDEKMLEFDRAQALKLLFEEQFDSYAAVYDFVCEARRSNAQPGSVARLAWQEKLLAREEFVAVVTRFDRKRNGIQP
jgi:hypothetical protein